MSRTFPLLTVEDLSVNFRTGQGSLNVLDKINFTVAAGEIVGIVGESGSGKSVTALALMDLLHRAAQITSGRIVYDGRDLLSMSDHERTDRRGKDAAIIFQNPRAGLNPTRRIGQQIGDVIARYNPYTAAELHQAVYQAMRQVRIADPEQRVRSYPHELSTGQCQRVAIAAALACPARLLIADEPTTGLDVVNQAAIMELICDLGQKNNLSILLITHDLALAAQYCDHILVMHAGHIVESASVGELFANPKHPYTASLLRSVPSLAEDISQLRPIKGALPDLRRTDLPFCRFAERCDFRDKTCDEHGLQLERMAPQHFVACRNPL